MENINWLDELRTLDLFVQDAVKKIKIREKVLDRLTEYDLMHVTVSDIKSFMKKQLGKDVKIGDDDILKFLMTEENREKLIRFGQYKNPIDTEFNDYIYERYKKMDDRNYMEL